jgi:hypothetical protein
VFNKYTAYTLHPSSKPSTSFTCQHLPAQVERKLHNGWAANGQETQSDMGWWKCHLILKKYHSHKIPEFDSQDLNGVEQML